MLKNFRAQTENCDSLNTFTSFRNCSRKNGEGYFQPKTCFKIKKLETDGERKMKKQVLSSHVDACDTDQTLILAAALLFTSFSGGCDKRSNENTKT